MAKTERAGRAVRPFAPWLVLLAAAGAFALTMGVRQTMGLFLSALNTSTGLGVGRISLAFALGQLWWGLTQPFAGAVADRIGTGRLVPPEKRGLATGIVNAGGSFGQFAMAPMAIGLTAAVGWASAMQWLGVLVLLALPAAWVLKGNSKVLAAQAAIESGQRPLGAREAIGQALATPSYRYLAAGFLVCGFHVAFLATHLPGVIAACGLAPEVGGWALGLIGLFNIVGSLAMGWAVGRWRMKSLLSLLYATRAIAVLVFLFAPKTTGVVLVFAGVMGVTFLSTVPPTVGLVAKMFGTANMAMLFGIVMLAHQVVGFLGAYRRASTTGSGTSTSCWPWALRWSTCRSAKRGWIGRRLRERALWPENMIKIAYSACCYCAISYQNRSIRRMNGRAFVPSDGHGVVERHAPTVDGDDLV